MNDEPAMSAQTESWPRPHRLTVHDYYRMAEVGLLHPDDRTELIEGEIIDMPPIGPGHGSVVDRLTHLLVPAVGERAIVRVQGAVRLSRMSEPQPDVALLVPSADYYRAGHPSGDDTFLVIEVSDSTLRYDRDVKVPLYARHGVPEVWIVDVQNDALLVYGALRDGNYGRHVTLERPASIEVTQLRGVTLDLTGLFSS
jgi:Uma2 family endonuclease